MITVVCRSCIRIGFLLEWISLSAREHCPVREIEPEVQRINTRLLVKCEWLPPHWCLSEVAVLLYCRQNFEMSNVFAHAHRCPFHPEGGRRQAGAVSQGKFVVPAGDGLFCGSRKGCQVKVGAGKDVKVATHLA